MPLLFSRMPEILLVFPRKVYTVQDLGNISVPYTKARNFLQTSFYNWLVCFVPVFYLYNYRDPSLRYCFRLLLYPLNRSIK